MAKLRQVISAGVYRLWVWLTHIHIYIYRFLAHTTYFIPGVKYALPHKPRGVLLAIAEWIIYFLDITGVSVFYETLIDLVFWKTRPLSHKELELAQKYFGDTIDYKLVRIHPNAKFTARKLAIAYVAFNTINHWHKISYDIFIHEMMHVWQYQHLGSVYTLKALHAQYLGNPYEYGGLEGLYHAMMSNKDLMDFNLEQQAEIMQDYCQQIECNELSPMAQSVYVYYHRQVMGVLNRA